MPILKIPIKHYLGIVSQSQQEDFKKRFRKRAEETDTTRNANDVRRNPFETTEGFIEKYNQAQACKEREQYENLTKQFLSRCKRRAGFTSGGEGKHVDLPEAWTQLLLLSLCNRKVGNDSLDVLVVSLDHAPVDADQIPVLFHLAESAQDFLCSETTLLDQPCSYEMKMLQLGYLVSLRLFIFKLTGNLKGHQPSSIYLHSLKGLLKCETRYQELPNMLFAVHFMLRAGEFLCALKHPNDSSVQVSAEAQEHGVNQILWHCLLSYHCVQNNGTQLSQVIKQLMLLRDKLQHDNWAHCGLGLMILGEAAKSSMLCLRTLMNLHMTQRQESYQEMTSQKASWPWQLEHIYCSILIDICQNSYCADIKKTALSGQSNSIQRRRSGGLITLLKQSQEDTWRLRYSVVQGLAQISRRITLQDGLRNTAWLTLRKHLKQETDPRVMNAMRITEGDKRLLENQRERMRSSHIVEVCVCAQSERITGRLAHSLSQICSPVQLTTHSADHRHRIKTTKPRKEAVSTARAGRGRPEPITPHSVTKDHHKTLRLGKHEASHLDLRTRTDIDLIKVVKDQWQKELKIMMEREEEMEKMEETELEIRTQEEEEKIMKKRMEKVKKNTKPYELP
ncbi:transmembrane protein 232 isoform X1 [Onychostoma macrolepis]|uniref:transmembrane protein 232 isoform X1 n=1 Tax=Onychostoma macrolepis TaxID=369639 RepID=UPI00272AD51F|nr:transmembrane protein 232 isoform X1 [Onychostoma macrolepis]